MTHITEARAPAALTMTEIARAGVLRTARREEMSAAQSVWDSEGGVTTPGKPGE